MVTIQAKDLAEGQTFTVEEGTFKVDSIKVSNIGKHGRSKCRIEVTNTETQEKHILIKPSDLQVELLA